ncbi:VOC family protein [Sphingomonas solaris]|uniref:Glyoxalase n=1 Tax=Alterirhizorhabdus solaris TaxID=2529389 RepID=A0A558QWS5_9SPHN|nr:VOC family protein [Sphingomonas solaris]TVV71603.1 glyoxalase [Sphingomonas solaris]
MYLKYAVLPVADMDRAIAFYTGTLRLTLATDTRGDSGRRVELAFPRGETRLLLEPHDATGESDEPALVLTVPDVDAAFERLGSLGVIFVSPPADEGSGRCAAFHDSEGNLVLIESD